MSQTTLPNFITARQAYELWSSEPELMVFADLRENQAFQEARIPGAQWLPHPAALVAMAEKSPETLFVLIASTSDTSPRIAPPEMPNIVTLKGGFADWRRAGFPVCPHDRELIATKFNQEKTMKNDPLFFQLFEAQTSTYTYILADRATREAVIIDPVLETVDRDLKLIQEHGLRVIYILDTHVHADHITGAGELRQRTGAKTGVSRHAGVNCTDLALEDGQELRFGSHKLTVFETPGHTDSCLSFYCEGRVYTGDSLMIRSAGRTDFQQGSPEKLYDSITGKLFTLPAQTEIFPGHDYRGHLSSTVEMEMKFNPRIGGGKTKAEFAQIMRELKLAHPKKIHEALPANLACGRVTDSRVFHPQIVDGVPEITPQDLNAHLGQTLMIDVRRPDEFNNELGHVPGSKLVTLGEELTKFLQNLDRETEVVFICRSGNRSGKATEESLRLGFKKAANLHGGMILWNQLGLKSERAGSQVEVT